MFRKPIELETRFVPPWMGAIMVWPFILYRPERWESRMTAYMHTLWRQCRSCWVFPWYLSYFILGPFFLARTRWMHHPLQLHAWGVAAGATDPVRLAGKEGRTVQLPVTVGGCARRDAPAPHPGHLIGRMFVEGLGFAEEELAERLDVPAESFRAVLRGDEAVTVDFALRLERVTRVSADFWLAVQNRSDQWLVSQSEGASAIESLEPLPLAT